MTLIKWISIFSLNLCFAGVCANDLNTAPVVSLKSGNVRGLVLKSYDGSDFYAFKAIPYGKSTSGERRFRPPEPVDSWDGVFDASELGTECPQFNFFTQGVDGNENCLLINVYTPKISVGSSAELLPVLFFIHGGAFSLGTGSYGFYGPEKLIDYNVVLVTFNYRLGILGFMNTEDDAAPGNYGMLDQVLALHWVKENIAKFGGNSDQVTIFGESAGAASVVYHLLSPLSKGLFHRAISQSGSSINFWANQKHPLQWAKNVAEKADCPTNNTHELIKCLQGKSMKEVVRAQKALQITPFTPANSAPSIDGPGGEGFLIDDPLKLMQEGRIANKVPFIIGLNDCETLTFRSDFVSGVRSKTLEDYFDVEFPKLMSEHLQHKAEPHMKKVFEKIREEYLKDIDWNDIKRGSDLIDKLTSETIFEIWISQTADFFADANVPTWVYRYTHLGKHSFSEVFGRAPGNYAGHADELFLQFPFFFAQFERMNDDDTRMSKILNSLWSSFASGHNLTIVKENQPTSWPRYYSKQPSYLDLNLVPIMKEGKVSRNVQFWQDTIPKLVNEYKKKDEL